MKTGMRLCGLYSLCNFILVRIPIFICKTFIIRNIWCTGNFRHVIDFIVMKLRCLPKILLKIDRIQSTDEIKKQKPKTDRLGCQQYSNNNKNLK